MHHFEGENAKIFLGRGHSPLPRPHFLLGRGVPPPPSPDPTPVDAFQTTFLHTGLGGRPPKYFFLEPRLEVAYALLIGAKINDLR